MAKRRDYLISERQVRAEKTYAELGALTPHEVRWLSQYPTDKHVKNYLSTIYGTVTLYYAFQQYNKIKLRLEREQAEGLANAGAVRLPS